MPHLGHKQHDKEPKPHLAHKTTMPHLGHKQHNMKSTPHLAHKHQRSKPMPH